MTLSECLERLANNELSNLAIVDKKTMTIKPEYIKQVVNAINSALTNLYTKLFIKQDSIIVILYDGKTDYVLTSEHNVLDDLKSDYNHYIYKRMDEKFNNDIIKITEVVLNTGLVLPLNDKNDPRSVYTIGYNTIQIPLDIPNMELAVCYQANHPKLDYDRDPNQILELPETCMLALFNHVAYQIHGLMNSERSMANSQNYLANYTLAINELIKAGVYDTYSGKDDSKFKRNGWC